jgi:hypothetical protein
VAKMWDFRKPVSKIAASAAWVEDKNTVIG